MMLSSALLSLDAFCIGYDTYFLTSNYTKMLLQRGLRPGPHWGSSECSPDLLAELGGQVLGREVKGVIRKMDWMGGNGNLWKGRRERLTPTRLGWVGSALPEMWLP